MLKYFFTLGILFVLSTSAYADDKCVSSVMPDAKIVGHGDKRGIAFHLYDAVLYAGRGVYDPLKPFALTLTYRMDLEGGDISKEAIRQMHRLGMTDKETLSAWHEVLDSIFPNVTKGDAITGLRLDNGQTLFCMSGRDIGLIEDESFGNYFFGIWLDERAHDQALRRKLMGKS